MRSRSWVLLVLLLGALLCAWPATAQEQGGSIEGVVKDSSGGVLPGVTVEARSPAVVGVSTAVTDAQGIYRFPALPPGTYEITANLEGFSPTKVANVRLSLGQLLKVELALSVGGVTETVQVKGEAPLIDTKQNASFATVQQDVIQRIPKGRDFTDVIKTAPGAQDESKSGGTQIDGASGSENRYIIDGMDTTNLLNGTSGKTMLVDFIQEVQVKSSGYNAEFGGSTGGVVSAITKSGSNSVRGGAGIYLQNNKWNGEMRPWHSYSPWNSNKAQEGLRSYDTPWQYYSPVGEIGGPLAKDKLWYYFGMAYTSNRWNEDAKFISDPQHVNYHFEQKSYAYYPNWNVTTQLSPNMRLRVSGSTQRDHSRGALPTREPAQRIYDGSAAELKGLSMDGYTRGSWDYSLVNGVRVFNQDAFDKRWNLTGTDSRNDVMSGNFDWVIRPTFFINATAGYYRSNGSTPREAASTTVRHYNEYSNNDASMGVIDRADGTAFGLVPLAYRVDAAYSDVPTSLVRDHDIYTRAYFNANGIWYKSGKGQHVVKAGFRYERFGNDIMRGLTQPFVDIYWGDTYTATDGRMVDGKYGYYIVNKTYTNGKVHSNNYSLWLQDSWTVNNKLTVNAGVRTENEQVPSYTDAPDAVGITFGFRDKIAPRLGFAYDVNGDSKWKLYGSFGYFYDITKLSLPRGAFGGDHWIDYAWTLDTYDYASIQCGEVTSGCPGTFIEQVDKRRASNRPDELLSSIFNRPGMTGVDPELKPYQTGEFTLGGDHEMNSTMSFGVRYTHKWLTRTIEDVGLLVPGVGEPYIIGNPGFGYTETMMADYPQYKTPKATRDYDAVEFRLRKRLANRWSADISYTWSRLWGNYSGLASSDENGRTDTNINRYYDALYMSYDRNQQQVFGLLPTDRPHVLKLQATYDLPWGTTVGAYGVIQSGLAQTSDLNWNGYPVYYDGRANLGRLPVYKNLDLNLQHDFRMGGNRRLTLQANFLNVLDLKSVTGWYSVEPYRNTFNLSDDFFFGAPWTVDQAVAAMKAKGSAMRDQVWFKTPDSFQSRREVRLNVKYSF